LRYVTFLLRCARGDEVGFAARSSRRLSDVTPLCIELGSLSATERRDLANALLRAAWSATLEEIRILLLDLLLAVDDSVLGDPA
jgi:hypothetical protein